ncbi:hypothetical protein C0993_008146 [Termitomyces sp. T159_Od127]|nr:hypothetical protein C0993_008146 [Termitomyces sp. T159_Od127]
MALFVHLLRILMLFLNIYDSYKTLRLPPPSSRNEGRPSQRALIQRKRDMKGCLAVWIVWMCIFMYEGYVEGLVSLFVPFYDEIKSLGLLFLIMTRAKGAEPIFLNFIRPLVKPYSPTIDLVLDLSRMFGDILFVVLAIPTEYVHVWYKKYVSRSDNSLYSETDSNPTTTTPLTGPVPNNPSRVAENGRHDHRPVRFSEKKRSHRKPSDDSDHQPSRSRTRVDQVGQRAQARIHLDPHQIWYPPPSSYTDEEDAREAAVSASQPPSSIDETRGLLGEGSQEQKTFDEWRQYPAFPSAYPPTPMAVSTVSLPKNSTAATYVANSLMLAEIPEEALQQDFSKSLLPPRKPLDPGFVKGLSDEIETPGVRYDCLESMSVDSFSEDEDSFNTTFQTPMRPLPATRSILPIDRGISVASSVATQSTALTSNTRNSLETQSSIDSLSSDDISMSDFPPVLGKKRSLPLDVLDSNTTSQIISRRNGTREVVGDNAASQRVSGMSQIQVDIIGGDTEPTLSTRGGIDDQKPKSPKRRKVSPTKRKILVTRPRVARHAPVPTKCAIPKPIKVPTSSRDVPGRSTKHCTDRVVASNASRTKSSFSIDEAAKKTARPTSQSVVKENRGKSRQLP